MPRFESTTIESASDQILDANESAGHVHGTGPPPAAESSNAHFHTPTHPVQGTGGRLLAAMVVLTVVLLTAFLVVGHHRARFEAALAEQSGSSAAAADPVDVARVDYAPAHYQLTLPGQAAAWYSSTIYARVSGYVDHWRADIGDRVKQGDVLATIDTPELDDQLKAARAKVAADQSEVAVAQSNSAFAKLTNERWKNSPKGVVSEQERDEKEASYQSSLARLEAARSQVQFDQAEVNRLEALSEFKKVIAPYGGVITRRQIDIGDLVTAGSTSSTTPLFDIAQSDQIRVFVDVPQASSTEITTGTSATATGREFPGRVFTGTVARTSRAIDAAKTMKVEVDIQNQDLALLPGMYLEVIFDLKRGVPAVRVPASALNFRSGGPQVAIVDDQNRVSFRPVTIARDLGEYVELASGLSPGQKVALNLSNQIGDGDRIAPNASAPTAERKAAPTVQAEAASHPPAS